MKKITFFLVAFLTIKAATAQVSFESYTGYFDSNAVNYFKGVPGVPGDYPILNNGALFMLRNDTSAFGDYWSGWAVSRLKDSMSVAYDTNVCAAFPAVGHNGSNVYAVAYQSFDPFYNRIRFTGNKKVSGLWVTNSTIAYRSMQNGDFAAKKFGGVSGNDSDYYRVIFKGWNNGAVTNDSVIKYLADFRDANNANDYIVKDWQWVDLYALENVDSITYYLESSDNGAFGMNTPAYFCMDDLTFVPASVDDISANSHIAIYPNPFMEKLFVTNKSEEQISYTIIDNNGKRLNYFLLEKNQQQEINTNNWSKGFYFVKVKSKSGEYYYKIVK